jgi:hypothetical protein
MREAKEKYYSQFEIELSLKIIELEQQKAELIEFVKDVKRKVNYNDAPLIYTDCREILNKLQKE